MLIVPINTINNKSIRNTREIRVRPFPQSGLLKFKDWIMNQSWDKVFSAESAHKKAEVFQDILINKLEEIFPEKTKKINSDDQPWMTLKLKKMDRKKKRIYRSERKSQKWKIMDKLFRTELKSAKANFYKQSVAELKQKKPGDWFRCLKKITSADQIRDEQPTVQEINHLSDQEQAEAIAEQFAKIQNEYKPLKEDDIYIPTFTSKDVPVFQPAQVWFALCKLNTDRATVPGDFPAKLAKTFAAYLAEPLADIINTSVRRGEYPNIYKFEVSTPVPKVYPTQSTAQLRNISGLFNFDKIFEKLLAEMMISDMSNNLDPAQYGNQKGLSIQHYLINMIHRILTVLDNNSRRQTFAIIASLIDWKDAFPRQCPKLGVQSFIKNGVRPALIPVLVNYFQDRKIRIHGGAPQGATLGILEYLSQSNNSADLVQDLDRFKFVDDLSVLEIVDLLTVGITSYNLKYHIPSDLPLHNQYIPAHNLKSQNWLDDIHKWTVNQKMVLNPKKTKNMIFNFTNKYKFSTRLKIDEETIETVPNTRLLGTIIEENLSWDLNTANVVRKANASMQILRRVASFGASDSDMKDIYILFVRSLLEQSATVWHSSLSQQNISDLERVQKTALKIILGGRYRN